MKFELGQMVMTRGIVRFMEQRSLGIMNITKLLDRHLFGDWGDVSDDGWTANDEALEYGDRLLSAYVLDGENVCVITEAEVNGVRAATTVLFPSEY